MSELIVAACILGLFAALSFAGWYLDRRARRKAMQPLVEAFERATRVIGEALIPAFRSMVPVVAEAAQAFEAFAAAFRPDTEGER